MTTQISSLNPEPKPRRRIRRLSLLAGLTLAVSALSPAAYAHDRNNGHQQRNFGRVIDVRPVYTHVLVREPRQQCSHRGGRNGQRHSSQAGSVFGGIVGGVIGNTLSRGHNQRGESRGNSRGNGRNNGRGNDRGHVNPGRVGATVAGAILGATIGHQVSRGHDNRGRHAGSNSNRGQHCVEVYESHRQRQLDHYKVTYVYQGRRFTTTTQHRPGNRIEVQRPGRRHRH